MEVVLFFLCGCLGWVEDLVRKVEMAEDVVLGGHGEVGNEGRDGEFEVESKVESVLRACIDSHPLTSGVCDGTAESAYNNSLLSSVKLRALESIVSKQSLVKYEKD